MDGALYVPLKTDHWLPISVWDASASDWLTGAVTGDFQITLFRATGGGAMQEVTPHGLYVHEIGKGLYHLSNSSDSSTPYQSSSEEQVHIRVKHDTYGGTRKFEFWARDLVTEIVSAINALLGVSAVAAQGPVVLGSSSLSGLLAVFDTDSNAEWVTYTPEGESGFLARAYVDPTEDPKEQDGYAEATAIVHIRAASLEDEVDRSNKAPQENDTVAQADGTTWIVRRIVQKGAGIWTLEVTRDERRVY